MMRIKISLIFFLLTVIATVNTENIITSKTLPVKVITEKTENVITSKTLPVKIVTTKTEENIPTNSIIPDIIEYIEKNSPVTFIEESFQIPYYEHSSHTSSQIAVPTNYESATVECRRKDNYIPPIKILESMRKASSSTTKSVKTIPRTTSFRNTNMKTPIKSVKTIAVTATKTLPNKEIKKRANEVEVKKVTIYGAYTFDDIKYPRFDNPEKLLYYFPVEQGLCGVYANTKLKTLPTTTTKKGPCPTGPGSVDYIPSCQRRGGVYYYKEEYKNSCDRQIVCFLPCTKSLPTSSTKKLPVSSTKTLPSSSTKTLPVSSSTKTLPVSSTKTPLDNLSSNNSVVINNKTYCSCEINSFLTTDIKECEEAASKLGYKKEENNQTCIPSTIFKTVTEHDTVTVREEVTITVTRSSVPTSDSQCVGKYGQCGGINYKGPTCCQSGLTCHKVSEYYFQCLQNTN